MIFTETNLKGAFVIEPEPHPDQRGFLARAFCATEFEEHGLKTEVVQCNLSFNYRKGAMRGMHYQVTPATEAKLVRCIRGAIYDVIVDLRPGSPTYLSHFGVELTAGSRLSLYVPEMFAHGYQALTDEAEVLYMVSEFYTPACERGLRHDDPAIGIEWPVPVTDISEKDAGWPLWNPIVKEAGS